MEAKIFEIKRFAVHDGDGIRTTVFFKGCSLKCVWCHNPEGIGHTPVLGYYSQKCISCGECVKACPNNAHKYVNSKHIFDRNSCIACGKCENVCLGNALFYYGRTVSLNELFKTVMQDEVFYKNTNGGVTLSGGECLLQANFCKAFLKKLKAKGINTAVDTCGYVSKSAFDMVIPYTDKFLFDMKAFDENVHMECTGHSNKQILENLEYLDSKGCKIEIRIPLVPGYNDSQVEKMAQFLSNLKSIVKIVVLPYHNYSNAKYESVSLENTMPKKLPTDSDIAKAKAIIKKYFSNVE